MNRLKKSVKSFGFAWTCLAAVSAHSEGGNNPGVLAYMQTPEFAASMDKMGFARSDWNRDGSNSADREWILQHQVPPRPLGRLNARSSADPLFSTAVQPLSNGTPTGRFQCTQLGGICFREIASNGTVILESQNCPLARHQFDLSPQMTFSWPNVPSGYTDCNLLTTQTASSGHSVGISTVQPYNAGLPHYSTPVYGGPSAAAGGAR